MGNRQRGKKCKIGITLISGKISYCLVSIYIISLSLCISHKNDIFVALFTIKISKKMPPDPFMKGNLIILVLGFIAINMSDSRPMQ